MKTARYLFTSGLLMMLFSCMPATGIKPAVLTTDTVQIHPGPETTGHSAESSNEQDNEDSIRLAGVLQGALKIAHQHLGSDRFQKQYEVTSGDAPVSVAIGIDYFFTKSNPHLIIRRQDPNTLYIDVYARHGNQFQKVLSHEQWLMTYVNDTVRDINGDGLNDFVVNWYGSNGCCLKAFSNVYLLHGDKKGFSDNFEFINPTFSPKEHMVRGVCYGHPGETEMYKYRWNGEQVDTLEYVSFEKNEQDRKTGKIVISPDREYGNRFKPLRVLDSVPAEYTKIEGYSWFMGDEEK